jgi:DNA topoisomerase I
MPKNLVIVESPAKAKTIEKFLGKDYTVKSSYGHIRDLDKGDHAIDIGKHFKPHYIVPDDKKKVVQELKKLASESDVIWLASDEDREGEAISWHLFEVLGLKEDKTRRIVFNEITQTAILRAIQNPRKIDINLVNAQQARRVLDRLVGFELSPLLWRKVKPSLSAGRVQSVSVRLVVEREREIRAFNAKDEFRVLGTFKAKGKEFKAVLNHRFTDAAQAEQFLQQIADASYKVLSVEKKPLTRNPAPPFTTSTLQQEASRKLGYSVSATMQLAQKLYEEGHITYMRTDSVNLSDTALQNAKNAILAEYGESYAHTRKYSTKSAGAQEAHEAIRPTYFDRHFAGNSDREKKLYHLIWKRSIASQMAQAKLEKTIIDIEINGQPYRFVAEGEVVVFDGFLKVYMESNDDEEQDDTASLLPPVAKDDTVLQQKVVAEQRYNRPPPRYTEASLVKKLEELGIGRPSTYAPTISTIQKRGYVEVGKKEGEPRTLQMLTLSQGKITKSTTTEKTGSEKGKLIPTDIGNLVTDFLSEHFTDIMDYGFTASVEKEFDIIAEGQREWNSMIDAFYHPFHDNVNKTLKEADKVTGERTLGMDPKSGLEIIAKMGKYGPYVQLGVTSEDQKPKYASLRSGQNLETISLEEAIELFKLPRQLGSFEDLMLEVNIGRYGPYVKQQDKFFSIPKELDPYSITFDEAVGVIKAKREEEGKNGVLPLKLGEWEGGELEVNNGRFGPYVKYLSKYYSLPKGEDPTQFTKEQAIALVESKLKEAAKNIIKTLGDKEEVVVMTGKYGPYFTYKKKNYTINDIDPQTLTMEQVLKMVKETPAKKKTASASKRKSK